MQLRIRHLFPALLLCAMVSGCAGSTPPTEEDITDRQDLRRQGSGKLFGDDAFIFGPGAKKDDGTGGVGIAVNSFLWRASLDTMSFMPLSSADPFGGVIITDWYTPPETPDERLKLTVYILDRELRADGLRVAVFRQRRDSGGWVQAKINPKTATDLENAILTRARQLWVDSARLNK